MSPRDAYTNNADYEWRSKPWAPAAVDCHGCGLRSTTYSRVAATYWCVVCAPDAKAREARK